MGMMVIMTSNTFYINSTIKGLKATTIGTNKSPSEHALNKGLKPQTPEEPPELELHKIIIHTKLCILKFNNPHSTLMSSDKIHFATKCLG